jgi:ribosomal protein L7/L12
LVEGDDMNEGLPTDVMAALQQGKKIEAIKLLREARGIGLKEAKEAVERQVQDDPMLRAKLAAVQAEATRALIPWLLVVGAVALGVYYLLWSH